MKLKEAIYPPDIRPREIGIGNSPIGAPGAVATPGFADVAAVVVDLLADLGVAQAFGVTGGPIAHLVHAIEDHQRVGWIACRTEAGAVFQGIGAHFATGSPFGIVTTSCPGMLGTRQPLEVARREGVHAVMLSPRTPAAQRGRRVPQNSESCSSVDFNHAGPVFDLVTTLESVDELEPLAADLSAGLSRPEGFLAHLVLPSDLLVHHAVRPALPTRRPGVLGPDPATCEEVLALLGRHRFFLIVGVGARDHAPLVRSLVEATGAPVVLTPGAKGIVDERNPAVLGVTGIGGHGDVVATLGALEPGLGVVLGTSLSRASVSPDLVSLPTMGLVHVDRNPFAMGAAWPVPTLAVQSDLGPFLETILARPELLVRRTCPTSPGPHRPPNNRPRRWSGSAGTVRPESLMDAVQEAVIDGSDALVMLEVGSIWPWTTSRLAISEPDRFSLEVEVGCMGRAFAGAVGAAIAGTRKVVAIVGDWSADMAWPELRTGVDHDAPVVWIVFNTSGGQMVIDGDRAIWGRAHSTAEFKAGDLAAAARAVGAQGIRVTRHEELVPALAAAMACPTPFLVDVAVDTSTPPPYGPRFSSLRGVQSR